LWLTFIKSSHVEWMWLLHVSFYIPHLPLPETSATPERPKMFIGDPQDPKFDWRREPLGGRGNLPTYSEH